MNTYTAITIRNEINAILEHLARIETVLPSTTAGALLQEQPAEPERPEPPKGKTTRKSTAKRKRKGKRVNFAAVDPAILKDAPSMIGIAELADLLGCNRGTLYAVHDLPRHTVKAGGRRRKAFRKSDVRRWLKALRLARGGDA